MQHFQRGDWPERRAIIDALEDDRFRELGNRVLASERFDLLSDQEGRRWRTWRRERLLANGDVPWLSVSAARAQLARYRDSMPNQQQQLSEIDRFLEQMAA
jgi:exonuclease I